MHTVLANENKIYVFGNNDYGQLGLGHYISQNTPQLLVLDQEVSQIASGALHTIILKVSLVSEGVPEGGCRTRSYFSSKSHHDILVFGCNEDGQLGLGHYENQDEPQLLMQGEDLSQIVCGAYHTVILKVNLVPEGQVGLETRSSKSYLVPEGQVGLEIRSSKFYLVPEGQVGLETRSSKSYNDVLVFGANDYGQLGLGHNKNQNKPQLLMRGEEIRQITCGSHHTVILKANDDILVFGANNYGQLGLGHNKDQNKPQLLMHGEEISQIACGGYHTIILKANHDVLVFGNNDNGQLGLGHHRKQNKPQLLMRGEKIRQIACGGLHTIISKANHDVVVFGNNESGQLGLGHYRNQNKPQLLMQGEEINQIACGKNNTIILKANHDVLVFGHNVTGRLGLGHYQNQNKPQLLSVKGTLLSGILIYSEWSPEHHSVFLPHFQKSIYTFLLAHKRLSLRTGLKIPKFVLFEIFKRCVQN